MEILIKLLIVHFLGDFVLQTDKFNKKKEKHKLRSYHLYIHALIHGLLSWLLLWKLEYWYIGLLIFITHLIIDAGKLYFSTKKNQRWLFALDQLAHIIIIVLLASSVSQINFIISDRVLEFIWPLLLCVVFLTSPVAIMLKVFFTRWKLTDDDTGIYGLKNAGRWIGMIERLLIFLFIITDNFSAVGLLLTAKSVFRFGDLSKAKNMKLTEYVLIGTLLSFGIAILIGLLFKNYMI
ncbi:uncharacterized protein DUF3307 [Nonlabens dokdonensis]|jgi:hypothetical protein|uniref:DUF3307 domain-containing protein n=2 Tax=Nonlabens dokdonensis TaxID=328515 RepID=L7WDQ9_NONDD|nr:DUF3307 domain-containing protein [Nonlabens dokdonensis]AGC78382.1 hypothetical protein DDD_3255 [Nonlabens dokdonensis DSW-6]PZX38133.1 uncharacterized protein DUF3307 [Nonlabens dokdonensis]